MLIEICHKTRLKSKSSYNLLSSEGYRIVSETSKVSNFLWWDKRNNFRKKTLAQGCFYPMKEYKESTRTCRATPLYI